MLQVGEGHFFAEQERIVSYACLSL